MHTTVRNLWLYALWSNIGSVVINLSKEKYHEPQQCFIMGLIQEVYKTPKYNTHKATLEDKD